MKEPRKQLDVDRRIIAILRKAGGESPAAAIGRALILRYTGTYVRDRLYYLDAKGIVSLDRTQGRRGTVVRLRETDQGSAIEAEV